MNRHPASQPHTAPLHQLEKTDANVRTITDSRTLNALAASILAVGLMQNLVVYEEAGRLHVVAGQRRFLALLLLQEQGHIEADYPVRVLLIEKQDATVASLTENVQREDMNAADEFRAFHRLSQDGWSIDRIADAFGVTPLVVERRLRLAAAAPALLDLLAAGEINTDQLMALCATENHELQLSVWERIGSYASVAALRRAVLADVVAAADPRVAFIGGVEVYEAAGGAVVRDLFAAESSEGLVLQDAELLATLVEKRLEEHAEVVKAEGWAWVEVWPVFDWDRMYKLGKVQPSITLSPEAVAQIDALELEANTLGDEFDAIYEAESVEDNGLTVEQRERVTQIEQRQSDIEDEIESIKGAACIFPAEVLARAGAVVTLRDGKLGIERGRVRAEDRKALAASSPDAPTIDGGRESQSAGRKGGNGLSDALRRSLLGHRNLAAQTVAATQVHAAKVLHACWLVTDMKITGLRRVPCDLRIGDSGGTRTGHPIADASKGERHERFDAIGEALVAGLPEDAEALWDALYALSGEQLDAFFAFSVARSLSLQPTHDGMTARFLDAIGFDMADHFEPNVDNFLSGIPKAAIITALGEAGKIKDGADQQLLTGYKKDALAAEAAKRLAGSRWVPSVIRTPSPPPTVEAPAATEVVKGKKAKAVKPAGKARAQQAANEAEALAA